MISVAICVWRTDTGRQHTALTQRRAVKKICETFMRNKETSDGVEKTSSDEITLYAWNRWLLGDLFCYYFLSTGPLLVRNNSKTIYSLKVAYCSYSFRRFLLSSRALRSMWVFRLQLPCNSMNRFRCTCRLRGLDNFRWWWWWMEIRVFSSRCR